MHLSSRKPSERLGTQSGPRTERSPVAGARHRAKRVLLWVVAVALSLFASSAFAPVLAVAAPIAELVPAEDGPEEIDAEARVAVFSQSVAPRSAPRPFRILPRTRTKPTFVDPPRPPIAATQFVPTQRKTLLRLHV